MEAQMDDTGEASAPLFSGHWLNANAEPFTQALAMLPGQEPADQQANDEAWGIISQSLIDGGTGLIPASIGAAQGYLVGAYACHEAARRLREQGHQELANDRDALGQLFTVYVGDCLKAISDDIMAAQQPKSATKH